MDIDFQSYLLVFVLGLIFIAFGSGAGMLFAAIGLVGMTLTRKSRSEKPAGSRQR